MWRVTELLLRTLLLTQATQSTTTRVGQLVTSGSKSSTRNRCLPSALVCLIRPTHTRDWKSIQVPRLRASLLKTLESSLELKSLRCTHGFRRAQTNPTSGWSDGRGSHSHLANRKQF